jgi:hypothetical protein
MAPILWLIFWIAAIGTVVWFFRRYAPVAEWIKTAVVIVAIFVIIYLILLNLGAFHLTSTIRR